MNRFNTAAGAAAAPSAPSAPANPYFTKGNPGGGVAATQPGEWWFHMITEEMRNAIVAAGITPDHTVLTQLTAAIQALAAGSMAIFSDQKSSTTNGGGSSSGVQTRTLNTTEINTISGASLGSNQITLPAGTYDIIGWVPACNANIHRARLYNVTDSAQAILGSSENATITGASDAVSSNSVLVGRLVLAGTKVFEIRHYTSDAQASYGLGYPAGEASINEVYTRIVINKRA